MSSSEKGGSEKGGSEKGGSEKGGSEQGRLEKGRSEKRPAGEQHSGPERCAGESGQAAGELRIVAVNAIAEANAAGWDACANPAAHSVGTAADHASD
jgi:hypothetical protein